MKTLLAGLLVLSVFAVVGTGASSVSASGVHRPAGVVRHLPGTRAGLATVKRTSGTLACGAITCAAYETGVNQFFSDVAADSGTSTNVYSVDTQYGGSGTLFYDSTFGGSFVDTNAYPASGCSDGVNTYCLTDLQLATEIKNDVFAKGWPQGGTTNLFFILTPSDVGICFGSGTPDPHTNPCTTNVFCAYHNNFTYAGHDYVYAVEPDNATIPGCYGFGEFPNNSSLDPTLNTASHEMNEAITDPLVSTTPAYYSASGDEIGDLCDFGFGSASGSAGHEYNQTINGHNYYLQEEYSNADGGCVQHLGGTPSPITDGGTGPLTWAGGPVMSTNTVYTIYWIPEPPPVNSIAPAVSGPALVGQQLSTTNGTWTNSPTSYAYKWLRCGNGGTPCVDIANATSSTYKLVSADAGHTIRSEVEASNAGGHAAAGYTLSPATGVVLGKPAVIKKPVLSGTAKVGKALSVTKGTWRYAPKLTYQWLRCSATGTHCVKITGATRSRYTLRSADAGHKLRAQVKATNAAGSMTALSNLSAKVAK